MRKSRLSPRRCVHLHASELLATLKLFKRKKKENGQFVRQVCDTVAELASGTYEELGWPELLPFIFQCVQSNDARLQESSLLIFAQLARHIMGTLRQYMGTLHEVLSRSLTSSSQDVALAAMRATSNFVQVQPLTLSCFKEAILWLSRHCTCACIPFHCCACMLAFAGQAQAGCKGFLNTCHGGRCNECESSLAFSGLAIFSAHSPALYHPDSRLTQDKGLYQHVSSSKFVDEALCRLQELEDPAERDKFQSTIPAQLALIWNTLQAGDEGAAQEALELFIEIAEAHPRFLRRNLAEIANAMLQVGRRASMLLT